MEDRESWYADEDVGHLITVRRGWFKWGHVLAVGLLSFFAMGALFMVLWIPTVSGHDEAGKICLTPFFIVCWLLSVWGLHVQIRASWVSTIKLNRDYVRQYYGDTLATEIVFDPTVRVDVRLDSMNNCSYIEGVRIMKGDDEIELIAWRGWGEENLQNFWKPLIVVVRMHDLHMGDALEKLLRVNRVPEERAARDLIVRKPMVDKEKAIRDWITRAEAGTHETRRAKAVVEEAISSNDRAGKRIWHTRESAHPTLTTLKILMLVVLVGGTFVGALYESRGLTALLGGIAVIIIILSPWFWYAIRATKFAKKYYMAEVKLHPGATFRTLAGVLKAHGIRYTVNTNVDTMPSRTWGDFTRLISLEFFFKGNAYTIDVSGTKEARMWFGPKPEGGDPAFDTLLYHTTIALQREIEWKAAR